MNSFPIYNVIKAITLYLLFGLSWTPTSVQAQEITTNKNEKLFTIQGGVFYDWEYKLHDGVEYDLESIGALKLGLGWMEFQNNKLSEFLLEASWLNRDGLGAMPTDFTLDPDLRINKKKFLFEVEYFRSLLHRSSVENNFHAGITIAANYSHSSYSPYQTNNYPSSENCLCLGLGAKLMYIHQITGGQKFVISSNINVVDTGIEIFYKGDPNIFVEDQTSVSYFDANFFRPRIGLDFGFVF